ncbi:MAG: DUF5009 domain-containing protein [Candidatus Eremiobacteraeota bacterium]|nr:DUF5009 domain-containing protein [Candidatus Eremiobacteraeota bacterium]
MSLKTSETAPARLQSLDALRGITIILMLLVNNTALEATTPVFVMHAPWNSGVYMADYVFPWFLYCVGAALPFSWASQRKKGTSYLQIYLKAAGRTAGLYLLGCLINSSIAKQPLFTLGVLQLIALAYFVGTLLYVLPLRWRCLAAFFLLSSYWAFIKFVAIPGVGAGFFEENMNIIYYLNNTHLRPLGLAGILSVIPTAAMVMIGSVFGDLFRKKDIDDLTRLRFIFIPAIILCLAGMLWNLSLPYSKAVWTPAYILLMAGTASITLGILYFIIDMKGLRRWAYPLIVFGSNAIFAYVVPICVKLWIFQEWKMRLADGRMASMQQWYITGLTSSMGAVMGSWFYTFTYIFLWWLVLHYLYRKKIFLRV